MYNKKKKRFGTTDAAVTFQSCLTFGTLCAMAHQSKSLEQTMKVIEIKKTAKSVKVIRKDFTEEIWLWLVLKDWVAFGLRDAQYSSWKLSSEKEPV